MDADEKKPHSHSLPALKIHPAPDQVPKLKLFQKADSGDEDIDPSTLLEQNLWMVSSPLSPDYNFPSADVSPGDGRPTLNISPVSSSDISPLSTTSSTFEFVTRADSGMVRCLYDLLRNPDIDLQEAMLFLSQPDEKLVPVLHYAVADRLLPLTYGSIMKHQRGARPCLIAMSALRLAALHVDAVKHHMNGDGGIPLVLHTILAHSNDQDPINIPLVHACILTLSSLVEYLPNRSIIATNFAPNIFNTAIKAFPTEPELLGDIVSLHFSVVSAITDDAARTHLAAVRVPLRVLALPAPSCLTPFLRRTASLALAASLAAVPAESHARLCEFQPHPVRVIRKAIAATLHDVAAHFHIWRALELLVTSTPSAAAALGDGKGPVFLLRAIRALAFVQVDRLHAACLHVMACVARESPVAVLVMLDEGVIELILEKFNKWGAYPEVLLRACNVLEVIANVGNKERGLLQKGGVRYAVESSISSHISHFKFVGAAMGAIKALGGAVL